MAWTAPFTAVAGAAYTAAQANTLRDNLLETAPAKATTAGSHFVATGANAIAERIPGAAVVLTIETTTSTSYVNLATAGPAVTATTGTTALIGMYGRQGNSTANVNSWTSFTVTGATTLAASDNIALSYDSPVASSSVYHGNTHLQTGLAAGSNTFTQVYRVSSGTGTFASRRLWVVPF